MQTDSASQQFTAEEQARRERLIKLISAVVAGVVLKKLYDTATRSIFTSAGISLNSVATAMTRAFVAGSWVVHRSAYRYARVLLTDNNPEPVNEKLVRELLLQEERFERIYVEKAANRMADDVLNAVTSQVAGLAEKGKTFDTLTDDERIKFFQDVRIVYPLAVRSAVEREARYYGMRMDAVRQRVYERVEEQRVQNESPQGAYWEIDVSKKTHTEDCLAMAGKAWTWRVLSIIRPSNRHFGCGCTLVSLRMAQAMGRSGAEEIRDVIPAVALRAEHR